ncbi:MAG: glycoside hydrolase family 9 protein [Erysipelotrichales bacterium]|nr:glycoside hydrolase family 9 protein [Erysipelotrichales bacterium]
MNILKHSDASVRWLLKKASKSVVLHDFHSFDNLELRGKGELNLTETEKGPGVKLKMNMDFDFQEGRTASAIQFNFNEANWEEYNRVSFWIYPKSEGFHNFYFHIYLSNKDKGLLHAPSFIPNSWNHVCFEIPHLKRDKITRLAITPYLPGAPDEALPEVEFIVTDLKLELVDADYTLGWDLEDRIAYCHSGYLPKSQKIALTQKAIGEVFQLLNKNEEVVFEGKIALKESDLGKFGILDFSKMTKSGSYCIKVNNEKTPYFLISKNCFKASIEKSLNFLYALNCGKDIPGIHSDCHLNSYTTHPDGRMLPNHGGWHDAADLSQFEICTAEIAEALLDLSANSKGELSDELLTEARVGLNWLLRTRFGDGHRALAINHFMWKKSIVPSYQFFSPENPLYGRNVSESGPYENFIASSALIKGYLLFKDSDEVFARWCLRSGIQDFAFAHENHSKGLFSIRWGLLPVPQMEGAGCAAASELYSLTKEPHYLEIAVNYARNILECQEKNEDGKLPFGGFFYETKEQEHLLTYEHRGHEQDPIKGLVRLYEVAPMHPESKKWLEGIKAYGDYIKKTISYMSPYGMMPAQLYNPEKIKINRFIVPTSFMNEEQSTVDAANQIKAGIKLAENLYLRKMAVAPYRRGFHATILSKAKAVSLIAKTLKDQELKQIAIDQLEWILGKNPFASSTMTGEGHNIHPLYVAFSPQIEGALPVGIETLGDLDAPYWPVINNAVYKEIWGHTTGKYLWVLADLVK